MAKNDYMARQRAIQRAFFETGLSCGRQQIIDMLILVLHNPKYMNKDTFGNNRINIVINGIVESIDQFQKAWERDDETDYYRAKLDEALADALGQELHDSFLDRYEYAPEFNYNTGRWRK